MKKFAKSLRIKPLGFFYFYFYPVRTAENNNIIDRELKRTNENKDKKETKESLYIIENSFKIVYDFYDNNA